MGFVLLFFTVGTVKIVLSFEFGNWLIVESVSLTEDSVLGEVSFGGSFISLSVIDAESAGIEILVWIFVFSLVIRSFLNLFLIFSTGKILPGASFKELSFGFVFVLIFILIFILIFMLVILGPVILGVVGKGGNRLFIKGSFAVFLFQKLLEVFFCACNRSFLKVKWFLQILIGSVLCGCGCFDGFFKVLIFVYDFWLILRVCRSWIIIVELTGFYVWRFYWYILKWNWLFRLCLWFLQGLSIFLFHNLSFYWPLIAVNFFIRFFRIINYLTLFHIVITKVSHKAILRLFSVCNLRSDFRAFGFSYHWIRIRFQRLGFMAISWFRSKRDRGLPELCFHSGDRKRLILLEYERAIFLGLFRSKELLHLVHEHRIRHDVFHVAEDFLYFMRVVSIWVIGHESRANHWGLGDHELVYNEGKNTSGILRGSVVGVEGVVHVRLRLVMENVSE